MTVLGRIFHTGCERTTTSGGVFGGLFLGTLTGTGLVTVASIVLMGPFGILALFFSFFIWAAGLFLVAAPGWWLLHALGARCQQAAMIYGGLLTYAVCLTYLWLDGSRPFEAQVLWSLPMVVLTAIGVIVGWVVAKVAYEPAKAS